MTTPQAQPGPEMTGLASAQTYAAAMAAAYAGTATGTEAFAAGLSGHGVDGPAVAAVNRAQELTPQAGAAWSAASAALDQQTIVKEARTSPNHSISHTQSSTRSSPSTRPSLRIRPVDALILTCPVSLAPAGAQY